MEMDQRKPSPNDAAAKISAQAVEFALKGLAKLLGAIRFYPAGHPALRDVTRDARSGFAPLLAGTEHFSLLVRREGFVVDDKPVAADNPMLQKLAGVLFARRVQRLAVLADVSCRDLWEFAQTLLLDPADMQRQGGIQEVLQRAKVSTLWPNVVDLAQIMQRKQQLDAEKAALFGTGQQADEQFLAALGTPVTADNGEATAADTGNATRPEEMTLEQLLQEIERAGTDEVLAGLLPQLTPHIRVNLLENKAFLVLGGLHLLVRLLRDPRASNQRRDVLRQTLTQLATADILTFFISIFCSRILSEEQRRECFTIAEYFGEPLAHQLMHGLCEERDQAVRKLLSEALIRQGPVALPAVLPFLQDDRWYVVRNALYILGEIRDPGTVEQLKPLLQHADLRVRREAIRALTRIGGNYVIGILLRTLQEDDPDLRRQAMLSLGAMKNATAVPALVQYLQTPDWRVRELEGKKDALRALGEIGSEEALPALLALARQRRFLFSSRHNELRAAAVSAIGDIGSAATAEILEQLSRTSAKVVARAAVQALKQVRKAQKK